MRRARIVGFAVFVPFAFPAIGPISAAVPTPTGVASGPLTERQLDRLVALAKVWGAARTLHPELAYRPELDWDAALATAAPEVLAETDAAGYAAAVGRMLEALRDPSSRVVPPATETDPDVEAPAVRARLEDGTLVLRVGNPYRFGGPAGQEAITGLLDALPEARALVLDLRSPVPTEQYARFLLTSHLEPLMRRLPSEPLAVPGSRRRVYYGYESDTPFASGQYRTGWLTLAGGRLVPSAEASPPPLAFLLDSRSVVPSLAVPLQIAGQAAIVFTGDPAAATTAELEIIPLEEGWTAQVRVSEPIDADGRSADLAPDVVIEKEGAPPAWDRVEPGNDPPLAAAIELARSHPGRGPKRPRLPVTAPVRTESRYPAMALPDLGYRLLAAFRIYDVIERFYPYPELLDEPWERVLRESLPGFVGADTPLSYVLAVARMVERLDDSHAYVGSDVYYEHVGKSSPPVRVRVIEGRPVVAGWLDADAAAAAGVLIGDVVLEVDGENAVARLRYLAGLISASTPDGKLDKAALWLLNGPEGSIASVKLEGADGVRLVQMRRAWRFAYNREREGEALRILEGNIGYADLDRLSADRVEEMFETLRDTDGIAFDMRGYPLGSAWGIAPRLTDREGVPAARIYTPLVGHPEPAPSSQHFLQRIGAGPPSSWTYDRPTVMLIDERSQSQAEHTGLFLRAANGTRFVGSATAGANGEITIIPLPGGISVGFTGQAVEFPDGTLLQRRGLQPDLEVRPTIEGFRAGRDEVLEAAVRLLREHSMHDR